MKRLLLLLAFPVVLAAQQATPELSLTANNAQEVSLYPGWPLIVHVTIMNSSRFAKNGTVTPLTIAPNGASWITAIQFTAVDATGQPHQWPLKLRGTPADASLTLAPTSYVRATWQMSGSDVSALPPGTYQLTASLQVSNSNGWNGMVQSGVVAAQVGPEPALGPNQVSDKALLVAEYDANAGDLDSALTTIQQLLQSQPTNSLAMSAAADLLELQGYIGLAFFQANNALIAYSQASPPSGPLPSGLASLFQALFTQMTTPGSTVSLTTTSASGAEVTFRPADQTVTMSATVLTTGTLVNGGTVTFAITGVGNPVTSAPVTQGNASAVFTIQGGTHAGSYPIAATYNGTVLFSASTDSTAALKIDKATPTVTWSNPGDIQYGSALGLGQLNAAANLPGVFVYNPPAGTVLPAGPGQGLSVNFTPADTVDYNSATGAVSINVTPAPLTVAAKNANRQYGAANPSLNNAAYNGFVNGDAFSSLSGTLSCTTTATQTSSVGTYPITCSGLSSTNYSINFIPGTLTITPAPLTITANSTTKILNAMNPAFTWTASGFVNGENASVFTAIPLCNTTAGTTSPVGSYSIACSGANATNYTFSYVSGTLRIIYSPSLGHVIQPPINADGTSVFNQGRTVPAKFSVYDANGVSIGTSGVVSSFFLTGIKSGTTTATVSDVIATNNPDTAFRWDSTSQQWIFNITTGNLTAGSTYIYTITLNDGSTILFRYGLR